MLDHFPPYYVHLGIARPVAREPELTLVRRQELLNSGGKIHGGVLLGLLDAALSRAIRLVVPQGTKIATVDLTVHFVTGAAGEAVRAVGEIVRLGGTLAFARGEVVGDDGETIAIGSGVYRVVR